MSLENLRVFCEAARTLNFSQTALILGSSTGYVSKRIYALEQELGCRLFLRSTRQVKLTEQGEHAYEVGMRILDEARVLQEEIGATQNDPRGILRVATSAGFGRQIVSQALAEFSAAYPAIEVRLDLVDELLDLHKRKFDLDIRVGDEISPHYIARKLAVNYRVLCASPEYLNRIPAPSAVEELVNHRCLIIRERDHPVGLWKLARRASSETISVKVRGPLVTNNGEIAVSWALAGHGVVLRSIWDVMPRLRNGSLVRILPDYHQEANIWAVYPERLDASAKIKLCVKHLSQFFGTRGKDLNVAETLQDLDNAWFCSAEKV